MLHVKCIVPHLGGPLLKESGIRVKVPYPGVRGSNSIFCLGKCRPVSSLTAAACMEPVLWTHPSSATFRCHISNRILVLI